MTKRAFTLLELLVVIAISMTLVAMLAVAMSSAKAKTRQTACLNHLHQIGLGFSAYSLSQEGKYPMDVPMHLGGSMEFVRSRVITNTTFSRDYHHFLAISNEVPNVKVMTCPADRERRPATDYATFTNTHLSYWVNTKATPHATASMLAGDWNIHGIGATNAIQALAFTEKVHKAKGSVLFADGRVEITRTFAQAIPPKADDTIATSTSSRPNEAAPAPPRPPGRETNPQIAGNSPSRTPERPLDKPKTPDEKQTNQPPAPESSMGMIGESRRIPATRTQREAAATAPNSPAPREVVTRSVPMGASTETAEPAGEPWDTPGFRLFKLLAVASYLISLLWVAIALLLLYLRSRMAKREQERAAIIHTE